MPIPQRNLRCHLLGFSNLVSSEITANLGSPNVRMLGQNATVVQKMTLSCWWRVSRLKCLPLP
jgi:hypothetical protein